MSPVVDVATETTAAQVRDNVATATARLEAIRDRLPATLHADGGVRAHVENFPATQTVSGSVALDAATLSALENVTVAVSSGTVALDSATLAALEAITVSGSVALDAPTLAALENITAAVTGTVALDAPTLAALENITATISGSVAVTGPLTDAELRATAVPVADGGGSLTVDGTVALDSATLAALESVTAAVSGGTIALDAATLAALEAITVSGTVALDAATLTALENVNAAVTGTVALDAATLAALESVTATISGSVAVTGPLTNTELRASAVPVSGPLTDTQLRASSLSVADGGGSLTVDAPLGTPVAVRLSDGTTGIGSTAQRLHVDDGGASLSVDDNGGSLTVDGTVAVSNFPASGLTNTELRATPVDVHSPDTAGTGTITAGDSAVSAPAGDGTFRSGTPTAGSYVSVACPGGDSAWNVQITGTWTGTLHFEISLDSTNGIDGSWINVNGRRTGIVATQLSGSATANGAYRGNTSGAKYFRVRAASPLTGQPAIVARFSSGTGAVFLNASVPDPPRTNVTLGFDGVIGIAAEALASISGVRANAAVAAATSQAVTVGKTLRVMAFRAVVMAGGTAVVNAKVRLRANYTGAAVVGSPAYAEVRPGIGTATAVANEMSPEAILTFPFGLDFPSGSQIGISHVMTGTVTTTQVSAQVIGYEY
jgi:DUF4097 and DUF4098 domain-containing protein YvlB